MRNNPSDNYPGSFGVLGRITRQTVARSRFWKTVLGVLAVLLFFSQAEAAPEKIVLTAADGYQITGSLMQGESRAGVVLLHMFRHDRESWQPLSEQLRVRGITSLAIDLRGHGESRLNPAGNDDAKRVLARDAEFFKQMHQDAEVAVRYLIEQGIDPGRVGLVGASVGSSVAIHTVSAGKVAVAALLLMTPGVNYLGVPTMDHLENWPGPPLLILSNEEEQERGAVAIYGKLKNNGASLRVFEEEDIHGTNMFGEVEGVEKLIVDWLAETLNKAESALAPDRLPVYRIKLRVHLANSNRTAGEFEPIFAEINEIWQPQAGICFEIHTVDHDTPLADGLDMWFAPDIGGLNGYYDGERIQMTDAPVLAKASNPARSAAARTAAHELGHALDLPHLQESDDNLMRSKTFGWQLSDHEVRIAREAAADIAFADTAPRNCGAPRISQLLSRP